MQFGPLEKSQSKVGHNKNLIEIDQDWKGQREYYTWHAFMSTL